MDRHQNVDSLKWFRGCLQLIIGLCLVGVACADPPPSANSQATVEPSTLSSETEARIQEWIAGLSSQEYATRRRAFLELWKQGPVALPAVRRALTTSDQQTISAVKVLENLLNLDISPSDNDELTELMQLSGKQLGIHSAFAGTEGLLALGCGSDAFQRRTAGAHSRESSTGRFAQLIQFAFDQGNAFQAWPAVAQCLSPSVVSI